MTDHITQYDKNLLLQPEVSYKFRLLVLNRDKQVIDELTGLQMVGSWSVDSESDIRRTASFTMFLDHSFRQSSVEEKLSSWIGCSFLLQTGIYDIRNDCYFWYNCGYYLITEANTVYHAAENSVSATLSDWYAKLDGTRNGQIGGAPVISIPNTDENGNPVAIRQAVETLLKTQTDITDYIVDNIGQFYGMPENNENYEEYRLKFPDWNRLPYDLEFEAGCTVGDIFSEIRNLYPNCQMYFDVRGIFRFQMIPSLTHDTAVLDHTFLQEILIGNDAESAAYDMEQIKNVTEVFGANYEIDRFSTECASSTNLYTISLEDYSAYRFGDLIAFIPDTDNLINPKLRINGLDPLPLYQEYTEEFLEAGRLTAGKACVIRIKYVNGSFAAFYLGRYQPHALCVLTGRDDDPNYTKAYFSQKYNCDESNIVFRVEPYSPFTVQKLGELLDVKSGGVFDNINSDSAAVQNAVYYNQKSSSFNDTVTIRTKMIPFLDVNRKVEYKKQQDNEIHPYVVKFVEHHTDSFTSTIVMYRFYPLYYL